MRHILVIPAFYCSLLSHESFGQSPVVLLDGVNEYRIGKNVAVLIDPDRVLTIDSVALGDASRHFVDSKSEGMNFGHTSAAIWVKLTIENSRSTSRTFDWIITPDYSLIDKASLFIPSIDGTFAELKAGLAFPMSERAIPNRLVVFPLRLMSAAQSTFYMRFESNYSLPLSLKIWEPSAFEANEAYRNLVFGLFYGALFIMAFYNLFLFFSVKDLSYLYYTLFVICLAWYQANIDGLSIQLLTPNNPEFNTHLVMSSMGMSALFGNMFVREFLQFKKYSIPLDNFYKALIGMEIIYAAVIIPFSPRLGAIISAPGWMGSIFVNVIVAFYCLSKGNKNTRIYLIATLLFLAGSLLRTFRIIGIEEKSLLTEYGMQIGAILEMTLLSFALGNRINTIKEDEDKERALIRNRIAGDLHDEIGSNLSSISMSSQMMLRSSRLDEGERSRLVEMAMTARESAEALRDIVWFVDPDHDRTIDLIARMKEAASKMLAKTDYEFTVEDEAKIKMANLQIRRNIYLIFKELLHNVVKHSRATNVCIDIRNESDRFVLTFHDNGVGFARQSGQEGHGLKSLKTRAQRIGADFRIDTSQGEGTKATLSVPVS